MEDYTGKPITDFENLISLCRCVKCVCEITDEDYVHMKDLAINKSKNDKLKKFMNMYGMNMSLILRNIQGILSMQASDSNIPKHCTLKNTDVVSEEKTWLSHIKDKKSAHLKELVALMVEVQDDAEKKMKLYYEESSDIYSSYSDYSESSTDSDEEIEDLDDEDEDDRDEDRKSSRKYDKRESRESHKRRERRRESKNSNDEDSRDEKSKRYSEERTSNVSSRTSENSADSDASEESDR